MSKITEVPARRKPGAPKKEPENLTHPVALRLTNPQKRIYDAMGGAKWVRKIIDNITSERGL